jgi:hypothetical protein
VAGNIASLDTLTLGKRYPLTHAVRQTTQYGPTILVNLWDDPATNLRVLLPKLFADVFLDSDIDAINNGTRVYHLSSHGRTPNGRSFRLSLEEKYYGVHYPQVGNPLHIRT